MSKNSYHQDASYDEHLIEEIRVNTDLIELISEYTNLQKAGKSHKGLCPFHEENTPSFNVDPDKQLYYCFGCGAGGDVYNFLMNLEGMNFPETVEFLAERTGIQLPDKKDNEAYKKKNDKKDKLLKIHQLAYKFYNYLLTEKEIGKEAYQYLKKRDFSDEVITKFKLGFAPNRWQGVYKFLKKKGYSDQILAESGLVVPRKTSGYYDRFRGRVMFTICDFRGNPIAFGGRIIADIDQPKYLNSSETLIFNKSRNLYGLNWAKQSIKKSNEAIIFEGYTDVIRAHQFGIENVTASLGTALTRQQAKLLKRYADQIYIAYDPDTAGDKAALRGLDILKKVGLKVKVINLPQGEDPDDFIRYRGKDDFIKLKDKAVPLIDFKLNSVISDRDVSQIDNKVNVVNDVLDILAEIDNKIELDEHIKKLSDRLNVSGYLLRSELKKYNLNRKKDRREDRRNNINNDLKEKLNDTRLDCYVDAIDKLISIMLDSPRTISKVKSRLDKKDFIYDFYQEIIGYLFNGDFETTEIDINRVLQEMENEKSRDLLLRISVAEESENYNQQIINDYINKIKEYQVEMKKEQLSNQIRQAEIDGDNKRLSELLQNYQQLMGREGS